MIYDSQGDEFSTCVSAIQVNRQGCRLLGVRRRMTGNKHRIDFHGVHQIKNHLCESVSQTDGINANIAGEKSGTGWGREGDLQEIIGDINVRRGRGRESAGPGKEVPRLFRFEK